MAACAHRERFHSQAGGGVTGTPAEQLTDDRLIVLVRDLGGSDVSKQEAAWRLIESFPRGVLIDSLARVNHSLDPSDLSRVLIAFCFCRLNHEYIANRGVVVSSLRRKPRYANFHGDWSVSLIARLMENGDGDLLSVLLTASGWADGAMSDELAAVFVTEMVNRPKEFVEKLSAQSARERKSVYSLLFEPGNINREEIIAFDRNLTMLASSPANRKIIGEIRVAMKQHPFDLKSR